jgi:hypothetical protein
MQGFVIHANIGHFRELLLAQQDPELRETLAQLLDEEIGRLPAEERAYARLVVRGDARATPH